MIVTDQYEPMVGGVPTVTKDLARGLSERGHTVAVVAPGQTTRGTAVRHVTPRGVAGPDDWPAEGEPGWVGHDLPGSVRWPWYEGQRLALVGKRSAAELIARFEPDVVHLHSPLTLGTAARSAARGRVPVVYTNHYLPLNVWPTAARGPERLGAASWARDAAFYAYITGFANRCDLVTAPTATALRLLHEHGLRVPSQAVSNGVDLERFSPGAADGALRARHQLPADRPVVLSVGRLSPEKRVDVLIAAMARLADPTDPAGSADVPCPLLALAGAGPDESRLRSLARHYGVTEQVRFLGFVPDEDLPGLYRLADVFAIASQAELQSLVTMNALASGLPVVAADAGALAELVYHAENGFLARPGSVADMADGLARLCRDAQLRARMAEASVRIIADHDRNRLLARWESIYRALISLADRQERPQGHARRAVEYIGQGPARRGTRGLARQNRRTGEGV
jgi:glycosyltransferase involved in cell wall biosynthesis